MTLLLLFRPHRYGPVVAPVKGYAAASDAQRFGAFATDANQRSSSSGDAATYGSRSSDS